MSYECTNIFLFTRQRYIQGVPKGQRFRKLIRENSEEDKDDNEDKYDIHFVG
jgi:hypothetical protein